MGQTGPHFGGALFNISGDSDFKSHNNVFMLTLGYKIPF